ncbi:MAG: acyl--CoA ligase [Bdellovibrionales bacterium]|nr:acyl--CoA ligase [Bdellovibrionales bacterium]
MTDFVNKTHNIIERGYAHFKSHKSRLAFITEEETYTYEEVFQVLENLNYQFSKMNLLKGDSVLILIPIGKELVFILLALMKIGIIPILIDPRLKKSLWKELIIKSKPKMIISHSQLIKWHWFFLWSWRFQFYSVGNKAFGAKQLTITKDFKIKTPLTTLPSMLGEDILIKTLTSGTTGSPKVIHRNFSILESQQRLTCKYLPELKHDIHLSLYGIGILQSFIHGSTTVIINNYHIDNIIQKITQHKVTRLSIPPGILCDLMFYCEEKKIRLSSLKCILTGGAPIPLWFRKKMKSLFPMSSCYIIYGSTECEPISKWDISNELDENIIGYPVGKVIDEITLIKEKVSEIKGQNIFKISLKGENCATEINCNELNIGDLASFDSDGNLWLLGRSSEIIDDIPPAYIEEQIERIDCIKRSIFLKNKGENLLIIECFNFTENTIQLRSEDIKNIEEIFKDVGLGNVSIYKTNKLPVDPRHLWKIQRKEISSFINQYCHDKVN